MQGKIVKGIAGFYYVHAEDLQIYECRARGIFRRENIKPSGRDDVELEVLDQQIADNENLLKEINKKIEDKKAGWSYNGAALQATILEQEKKIADEKQKMEERHAWEAEQQLDSDDEEKKEKDDAAKAQIAYDEEVLLNLQEQVQYNSYEEQNNKEVRDLQRQAKDVEDLIASYKEYKAEMKSQKESSENGVLDQGSREKLEADTALEN